MGLSEWWDCRGRGRAGEVEVLMMRVCKFLRLVLHFFSSLLSFARLRLLDSGVGCLQVSYITVLRCLFVMLFGA